MEKVTTFTDYIMTAGFVVAVIAAVAATVSAYYAMRALQHNNRLTSVNIAAQFMAIFTSDEDMQKAYYQIEHKFLEYRGTGSFRELDMEAPVDKLLRHFSTLAIAWKSKLVKDDALRIVRYYILKILDDDGIQEYMGKVCRAAKKNAVKKKSPRLGEHPYSALLEMGNELRKPSAK